MAFTSTQLAAIETAIASGTLTVEYDGKRVTYQSLEALLKVREIMRKEIGITGTGQRRYGAFSDGLA